MSFRRNLVHARSHLVTLLALVVAFGAVIWMETRGSAWPGARNAALPSPSAADLPLTLDENALRRATRPLTEQEREWARIAWRYFENNVDPQTGLASSVENYPSATMWDTGSYLLAVIAARRLGLIEPQEFDGRIARALASLQKMPLFDGALPNKAYDTRTLQMTDYANKPSERGIGWSVIDLGRLLVPFNLLVWQHPQHTEAVRGVLARWNSAPMLSQGELVGSRVDAEGRTELVQEGRLGYEQYAARTFSLMGLDVTAAGDYTRQLAWADVEGVPVAHDRRSERDYGAHNYVVSEPYVLDGMELGWDHYSRELAWRLLQAQQGRWQRTGQLTAVTEDHLDRKPYFAYNTVFSNGRAWNTISEDGRDLSALRTLSVKASFGWHALFDTDYTRRLVAAVAPLHDPQRGWYAGRYEQTQQPNQALSANTNGIVLESLAFIEQGRFVRYR